MDDTKQVRPLFVLIGHVGESRNGGGAGEFAARMLGRGWDKVDRRGLAFMQAAGVQFTKADAGFVSAVKTKTANLEDNWAKAAEAKGLKDAKKVLADYRAEIAKLQK